MMSLPPVVHRAAGVRPSSSLSQPSGQAAKHIAASLLPESRQHPVASYGQALLRFGESGDKEVEDPTVTEEQLLKALGTLQGESFPEGTLTVLAPDENYPGDSQIYEASFASFAEELLLSTHALKQHHISLHSEERPHTEAILSQLRRQMRPARLWIELDAGKLEEDAKNALENLQSQFTKRDTASEKAEKKAKGGKGKNAGKKSKSAATNHYKFSDQWKHQQEQRLAQAFISRLLKERVEKASNEAPPVFVLRNAATNRGNVLFPNYGVHYAKGLNESLGTGRDEAYEGLKRAIDPSGAEALEEMFPGLRVIVQFNDDIDQFEPDNRYMFNDDVEANMRAVFHSDMAQQPFVEFKSPDISREDALAIGLEKRQILQPFLTHWRLILSPEVEQQLKRTLLASPIKNLNDQFLTMLGDRLGKIANPKREEPVNITPEHLDALGQELQGSGISKDKKENSEYGGPDLNAVNPGEVAKVTFEDVVGLNSVKAKLKRHLNTLRYPLLFKHHKLNGHSAILLTGKPGIGKTMLAKALANEMGANTTLFAITGSEFVTVWQASGSENLKRLEKAIKKAPTEQVVVFIDEVDALAIDRSSPESNPERSSTVNQLLTLMNGLTDSGKKVLFLFATNTPNKLDSAFKNRCSQIDLPMPNRSERIQITYKLAEKQGLVLPGDIELDKLGDATEGLAGRDIELVMK